MLKNTYKDILSSQKKWEQVSWYQIKVFVQNIQNLIYKSCICGDAQIVKFYQKQLISSQQANLLAVDKALKQVDSNFNKKINSNFNLNKYVYSNNKRLNLENKALHNLLLFSLQPEWEARLEYNSYGSVTGFDINQAIIKTYTILNQNFSYENSIVLSGFVDNYLLNLSSNLIIKKTCYSGIFRQYLINTLYNNNLAKSAVILNTYFQVDKIIAFQDYTIISLINNIIFYGFEAVLKWKLQNCITTINNSHQIEMVIYANHFIVIFNSYNLKIIINIINSIKSFFYSVGVNFNTSNLCISSIYEGFNFLGFNFKRLKNQQNWNHETTKLLIKPTNANLKQHFLSLRKCLYHKDRLNRWRANSYMKQYQVINRLNPIIYNFASYYKYLVPLYIMKKIDWIVNEMIYRYAVKKYKSARYYKWVNNWTQLINGKRMIAYQNEITKKHQILTLHCLIKNKQTRILNDYFL
nr:putative reverse transcriptase/maturase [Rhodochaete parvula]